MKSSKGFIIGNQDHTGLRIVAPLVCSAISSGIDYCLGGAALQVQHFSRTRHANISRYWVWGSTRLYAANMRYPGGRQNRAISRPDFGVTRLLDDEHPFGPVTAFRAGNEQAPANGGLERVPW
jgi:hypothetical protein